MSQSITRHFVRVRDREVHYRRAGEGPPFVLFHVSPQTSAFVLPHFLPLANRFTLVGLDAPGYGSSDPLPVAQPNAADYADAAVEALDALGIERAAVFGAHTGAHIALELALRHPARCALLVLDGLSINSPEEGRERLDRYAPGFEPKPDGSHLAWAWQHTRDQALFAPWFYADKSHRLDADMHPAESLHNVVLAKMNARAYWLGYRAAFGHEPRRAVARLTVPTMILARAGDWRATQARALERPDCARVVETDASNEVERIGAALAEVKADASVRPAPAVAPRPALYRSYSPRGDGERLLRRGGKVTGTPLVLLHDAMSGSRLLETRMRALGVNRLVIAPDIAGNADSDGLAANADIAAYAADTLATLHDAGVTRFDLYAEGLGAVLALAIAQGAPDQVGKLVLDRPILPTDDERADLLAHFAPPMEARWDGTHFLTAWHMLRDAGMFWPWYRRSRAGIRWMEPEIDPVLLQPRLIEWLKGKATYAGFARAAIAADTTALLRVTNQALVLVGTDLTAAHGERAAAVLPQSELLVAAADTGMIERFLTKDLITAL